MRTNSLFLICYVIIMRAADALCKTSGTIDNHGRHAEGKQRVSFFVVMSQKDSGLRRPVRIPPLRSPTTPSGQRLHAPLLHNELAGDLLVTTDYWILDGQ